MIQALAIYANLFFLVDVTEICSFANDTTFFACHKNLLSPVSRLEHDRFIVIDLFQNNQMKLNEGKCHAGQKCESIWTKIGEAKIWESNKQKLLGVQQHVCNQKHFRTREVSWNQGTSINTSSKTHKKRTHSVFSQMLLKLHFEFNPKKEIRVIFFIFQKQNGRSLFLIKLQA